MPPRLTLKQKLEAVLQMQNTKSIEKATDGKQKDSKAETETKSLKNEQDNLNLNVSNQKNNQDIVDIHDSKSSNSNSKIKESVFNKNKLTNRLLLNEKPESLSVANNDNTIGHSCSAKSNFSNNGGLNVQHKEGLTDLNLIIKVETLNDETITSVDNYQVNMADPNIEEATLNHNKNNSHCNDKSKEFSINDINEPTDTFTACEDKGAESQDSGGNNSTCLNPLKRKSSAANKTTHSNGNLVFENKKDVSKGKQNASDTIKDVEKSKSGKSGIDKEQGISKKNLKNKKGSGWKIKQLKAIKNSCNSKADEMTEPYRITKRQRNAILNNSYKEVDEDVGDFSDSSVSWAPSELDSDSDYETKSKKIKMTLIKQYTNTNRGPRTRAVVPQMRAPDIGLSTTNQNLPFMKNINEPNCKYDVHTESSEYENIFKNIICHIKTQSDFCINKCLEVKKILNRMKGYKNKSPSVGNEKNIKTLKKFGKHSNNNDEKCNNISFSNTSRESDEHKVLITNKYQNVNERSHEKKKFKSPKIKSINGSEMVPIGSGTTFVSKVDYERINWTTFAKATRCLLRAVFPRSVLATHSLTGKPSPAFKNKRPKMCLDPKKVSDIMNEVRDKFLIHPNCIRGVITTTCADESKMRQTRLSKNQENIPPLRCTKKASTFKPKCDL